MTRRLLGVTGVLVAVAVLWAPGAQAAKPAKKPARKGLVPHLCAWAAAGASSLELEGSCHEAHARLKTVHTPLGSATTTFYSAKWGVPHLLEPQHVLTIGLFHVTGSSAAVAFLVNHTRLKVIGEGTPVGSGKVTASWSGETSSCKNPPTGDCTQSSFQGVKGTWQVLVGVDGAPPGSAGAAEENAGEDEPQDLAQEETLKPATVGIGLAVLGKV